MTNTHRFIAALVLTGAALSFYGTAQAADGPIDSLGQFNEVWSPSNTELVEQAAQSLGNLDDVLTNAAPLPQ
ncbi:hypothetical protein [Streptomyces sp. NPDC127112]|uniref:hypothetical protein n=1 Tax=Streptomyces sp. NPDC127112 TaxID=3345364 RepID=UPI003632EC37